MFREPIEAVTVCLGYADFLAQTVPVNAPLFDRWLIITQESDEATREVARRYNLPTLLTEDGKGDGGDGGEFRKGRMVERGLQMLSAGGWRVHLDADIALPRRTRHLLEAAELQPTHVYGIDRAMCRSWAEWQRVLAGGWLDTAHDYHNRVRWPDGLPVGHRWANLDVGWVPIGFYQMWHGSQDQWRGVRNRPYPDSHNDACRTDVQHSLQWDRPRRALIPEVIGVHLESEPAKLGANWKGRRTKWFGPPDQEPPPWFKRLAGPPQTSPPENRLPPKPPKCPS